MSDEIKETIFRFIQEVIRSVPVFLLGSGASCASGIPGMGRLGNYLNQILSKNESYQNEWNDVYMNIHEGLESALQKANVSDEITNEIIRLTAEYIRNADLEVFMNVVSKEINLPLTPIIDYIFSGHVNRLDVITTNYDRLIEYACDQATIPYTTGFTGGYYKEFSLEKSAELYNRTIKKKISRKVHLFNENIPHVRILKLHGSVDWFKYDGRTFSLSNYGANMNFESLIVAPGLRKYLDTHHNPYREIISMSDNSISQGKCFFIVGYGFNDQHLEELLRPKVTNQHVKVIILTKELTESAKQLLIGTTNTLIITEKNSGVGTWCYLNGNEFEMDEEYWVFEKFTKILTGEDVLYEHIS